MGTMAEQFTDEEKQRILLELRYIYNEDELCQKWNISNYQLKKWKKAANYTYFIGTFRDMLIAALHNGTNSIAGIISYLDYLNHVVYTEKEIEDALNKLRGEGIAKEENGLWLYDLSYSKNDSSFIF
jgi:transposase-like protein